MTIIYRLKQFLSPSPVDKDEHPLRIGVLGAARIAPHALVNPVKQLPNAVVTSVAARNAERAKEFAKKNGIPGTHESYDALIQDPDVDAVYIPLPNGLHYEWAVKAIRAGKHVLVEKPATSNAQQAAHLAQLAQQHGVQLMEAWHWQFHPAAQEFYQMIKSGAVGDVQEVKVRFKIPSMFMPRTDIRFNYALAGGAMMDAGSYAVSASRFVAKAALGTFEEPVVVNKAEPVVVMENVDDSMTAEATFKAGDRSVKAVLEASLQGCLTEGIPTITVTGSKGKITYRNFIAPYVYHRIFVEGENKQTMKQYKDGRSTYYYMVKQFVDKCQGKETAWWFTLDETVGCMQLIDDIYTKAGMHPRLGELTS